VFLSGSLNAAPTPGGIAIRAQTTGLGKACCCTGSMLKGVCMVRGPVSSLFYDQKYRCALQWTSARDQGDPGVRQLSRLRWQSGRKAPRRSPCVACGHINEACKQCPYNQHTRIIHVEANYYRKQPAALLLYSTLGTKSDTLRTVNSTCLHLSSVITSMDYPTRRIKTALLVLRSIQVRRYWPAAAEFGQLHSANTAV
jgi:hypothetical protein